MLEGTSENSVQANFGQLEQILYRAATRTFHSTQILRNLFILHSSLAEFQLADKALNTYLDIVKKAKARVEKSSEVEPGLDDDSTALQTAAAGIKIFCNYGKRQDLERAQEIADLLEAWLQKASQPVVHGLDAGTTAGSETGEGGSKSDKPTPVFWQSDCASILCHWLEQIMLGQTYI